MPSQAKSAWVPNRKEICGVSNGKYMSHKTRAVGCSPWRRSFSRQPSVSSNAIAVAAKPSHTLVVRGRATSRPGRIQLSRVQPCGRSAGNRQLAASDQRMRARIAMAARPTSRRARTRPARRPPSPRIPRPPPASQPAARYAAKRSPSRQIRIAAATRRICNAAPAVAGKMLCRSAALNQRSRRAASGAGVLGPRMSAISTTESEKASTA